MKSISQGGLNQSPGLRAQLRHKMGIIVLSSKLRYSTFSRTLILFSTKEAYCHDRLQTGTLVQTPLSVNQP